MNTPATQPDYGLRISPTDQELMECVRRLRDGQMIAFPTETVYGLGANALDSKAVAQIFAAKGRPASNPLIVHVASIDAARLLSSDWTPAAEALAQRFWPGPLTIVVQAAPGISPLVTAGGNTVGLRIPAHPVAMAVLRAADIPVAAPSANRSEEVSPTTALHVAQSLGPYCEDLLILDGGPSLVGLESTVVDATGPDVWVLRPGMITADQIAQALAGMVLDSAAPAGASAGPARSPGQMLRHYAPRATVAVVSKLVLLQVVCDDPGTGGALVSNPVLDWQGRTIVMPPSAAGYAARLYAALRELDDAGVRRIYIEEPPREPGWEAIHDRLRRASTPRPESDSK